MIIVHFIILNADLLSTNMILHKTAMGNCDNVCIHWEIFLVKTLKMYHSMYSIA